MDEWGLPWIAGLTDAELGAAAAIDPEATTVDAPAVITDAGGTTDLAGKLNVAAIADVAPVSIAVVGRAGDDARRRSRLTVICEDEFGAAATVDPEAATVDTPGVVADAGRAADLPDEANVAATADVTPVAVIVVGRAGDSLLRGTASLSCGRIRCEAGRRDGCEKQEKFRRGFHGASLGLNFASDETNNQTSRARVSLRSKRIATAL